MISVAERLYIKGLASPDELRSLPRTKAEIFHLGETTFMKATLLPGWKWSVDIKPTVGTTSCEILHTGYVLSGRLRIQMNDGTEQEIGPSDFFLVPPGHDAWVIGSEPCVMLDFTGGIRYGK